MKQTQLFQKTTKEVKQTDISRNAELLTKAGYVNQLMAGAYTYLPMGLSVLYKIEKIIKEEMNAIGAQEILMPALQPKEVWEKTGRYDTIDVLFKLKGAGERDFVLGATHEEVITPLAQTIINSYKDLPTAAYQIQTKFRNEARAKSGLLRGREFRMKDLYSFHTTQEDLDEYYEKVSEAYKRVYERCGLGHITKKTYASGGAFSKYSHEYQTITEYGEDIIYIIPGTDTAINKEIINDKEALKDIIPNYKDGMEKEFEQVKAIEVGNIFKLGTKFSQACELKYTDKDGSTKYPIMGCYGIGSSRLMGAIAECISDDKGLIWPKEIAPYQAHLISLVFDEEGMKICEEYYNKLKSNGIEVLFDDRTGIQAGEKLKDSDLIGIPNRFVISKKTIEQNKIEWTERLTGKTELIDFDKAISILKE